MGHSHQDRFTSFVVDVRRSGGDFRQTIFPMTTHTKLRWQRSPELPGICRRSSGRGTGDDEKELLVESVSASSFRSKGVEVKINVNWLIA